MFQAGGLVVVLIEVARKAYLASLVPVIVNAILNEHQIIVDIVAFVSKGDFPRSRLNEKQRGKILAGWVSRKMRTVAQFAIKDMDSSTLGGPPANDAGVDAPPEVHRSSIGSFRGTGQHPGASSLRNIETTPQILEQRELEHQALQNPTFGYGPAPPRNDPVPVEMPADEREVDSDQTPTKRNQFQNRTSVAAFPHGYDLPDFDQFDGRGTPTPPPAVGPKPSSPTTATGLPSLSFSLGGNRLSQAPQIRLPGVDGRESLDDWDLRPRSGIGGTLAVTNNTEEEDDWTRDAYMSMNLAGTLGKKTG